MAQSQEQIGRKSITPTFQSPTLAPATEKPTELGSSLGRAATPTFHAPILAPTPKKQAKQKPAGVQEDLTTPAKTTKKKTVGFDETSDCFDVVGQHHMAMLRRQKKDDSKHAADPEVHKQA